MGLPSDQSSLINDLLSAIQDDDMSDVVLKGNDGGSMPVHGNRFLLAARSKVFRRMLYGSFSEATSTVINLDDYDSVTLEAIVEYCRTNEITTFRLHHEILQRNCLSARRLAQLFKAADYFELPGLLDIVSSMVHSLMNRYPPLSCGIYDEAPPSSAIYNHALSMIQCRPYVTLQPHDDKGGGIECLSPENLISILEDKDIQAGELFLFSMFQQWVDFHRKFEQGGEIDYNVQDIARSCAKRMMLEYIEPQDLLKAVKNSKLFSDSQITQAITLQALRASQNGVWSLSCRGRPEVDRILVEGAGSVDVNGIYYRIDGLANGELYSKREVACGQQHVYTLSCTVLNNNVECRIFSSKLLTDQAVRILSSRRGADPNFQPLLQIFHILDGNSVSGSVNRSGKKPNGRNVPDRNGVYTHRQSIYPSTSSAPTNPDGQTVVTRNNQSRHDDGVGYVRSSCQILLSDGEHYMNATMSPELSVSIHSRELKKNSLIKVLEYEVHEMEGKMALKLLKICLISQDPGHSFGTPLDFHDACELEDLDRSHCDDPVVVSSSAAPLETRFCREMMMQQQREDRSGNNGCLIFPNGSDHSLCELYSCRYPVNDTLTDSKIPRTGWKIDTQGKPPGPKCRWIQAPPPPPVVPSTDATLTVEGPSAVLLQGH